MLRKISLYLCVLGFLILGGCGAKEQTAGRSGWQEPQYVTVQHILIAFSGSVPNKDVTRTQEEARQLALALVERAEAGEDFDTLVEQYTDDSFPGVYELANHDAKPDETRLIFARSQMVPSFGDVAFSLDVGQFGLARYDPDRCRYGWHIIFRLK